MEETKSFIFNNVNTVNIYFKESGDPEIVINPDESSDSEAPAPETQDTSEEMNISIIGTNHVELVPSYIPEVRDYEILFEAEEQDGISYLEGYSLIINGVKPEDVTEISRYLDLLGEDEDFPGTIDFSGSNLVLSESHVAYEPMQSVRETVHVTIRGERYGFTIMNREV